MQSSTKKRWLIFGPFGEEGTLEMYPFLSAFPIKELRLKSGTNKGI
jgi:hypothetical protein